MRVIIDLKAFVFLKLISCCILFTGCGPREGKINPDLIGEWQDQKEKTTTIKIFDNATGFYSVSELSGALKISNDMKGRVYVHVGHLYVGGNRWKIDALPAKISVNGDQQNIFMVLESDTFYKIPYINDKCRNGIRDAGEEDTDCGGRCRACS